MARTLYTKPNYCTNCTIVVAFLFAFCVYPSCRVAVLIAFPCVFGSDIVFASDLPYRSASVCFLCLFFSLGVFAEIGGYPTAIIHFSFPNKTARTKRAADTVTGGALVAIAEHTLSARDLRAPSWSLAT